MINSSMNYRRMRNVSDKNCRENQNTHLMLNVSNPYIENLAFMA